MTLEKPDANTILVGSRETINRVPDVGFKTALAKIPERFAARLAFMTSEHHLVRNFVVREMPRENGMPIKLDRLAATLGLPVARVNAIVEELERNLFFLVRNEVGDISWAFPVTTDATPHRLKFSTGETAYGACAEDAFAMPLVEGRLRGEKLSIELESECAHCGKALHISIDSELNSQVRERDAEPLLFEPDVDWDTFKGANIIIDY
jgi:alkylmercury lyase-like protein